MYNPRFPHSLVLKRPQMSSGEIVFDGKGDPTYVTISLDIVDMAGDDPIIGANGKFSTTSANSIAFGYRGSGKSSQTAGDVVVSDFQLATPLFTTVMEYGDILELTDYDRTFKCTVVRKATTNFGCNIWCNEIKN